MTLSFDETIKVLDTIPHEEWPSYFEGKKTNEKLGKRVEGDREVFLSDNLKDGNPTVVVWSTAKFENCSSDLGIQYAIDVDGWKFRGDVFLIEVEQRQVTRRFMKEPNHSFFDTRSRVKGEVNGVDENFKITYQKLLEDHSFVDATEKDLR